MPVFNKREWFGEKLPLIGPLFLAWRNWREEQQKPLYRLMGETQFEKDFLPYSIDMSPLLVLPFGKLDEQGVLYNAPNRVHSGTYHPTSIAQYALAQWNTYLLNGEHEHKTLFLTQAYWLLEHEMRLSAEAGAWPLPFPMPAYHVFQPWLSALTQGNIISVFVRAYQLTGEAQFLQAAKRAVHLFELDILDGGVQAPVGEDGIFFEEVAVYPATHILNGYILAILGLYDYVAVTHDVKIKKIIQVSLKTLHTLLEDYDTGYWTRYDILHRRLASPFYHSLHIILLQALANYSGCEHCVQLAARWESYQCSRLCRLRYLFTSCATTLSKRLLQPFLRRLFFRTHRIPDERAFPRRICVPITAFPVAGGMRGVVTDMARVMNDQWHITYLTHHKGQEADGLDIEVFGFKRGWPGQFPAIWVYSIMGAWKLFLLLRKRPGYTLLLPQDGAFTGAFTALIGRMAGIRIVCMDHGNVTWLDNPAFRQEWMSNLHTSPWFLRLLGRMGYALYWPSLHALIRFSAHFTDHFLVVGEEVAEVYTRRLGVPAAKITRYAYMVDASRFCPLDHETLIERRRSQGIPEDALVITLINRLAPEKGLSFALQGIAEALSELAPAIRSRVRILIAGNGPLRAQIEADIQRKALEGSCFLWGEARPADVVLLLSISDIFLYSGTRGTNYSMAVLEAMAAGCAVIATTAPQSNAKLLAEERGIAIKPGESAEISSALVHLCNDPALCHQMGQSAREYILAHHTAGMLKRKMLRASYFAPRLVATEVNE